MYSFLFIFFVVFHFGAVLVSEIQKEQPPLPMPVSPRPLFFTAPCLFPPSLAFYCPMPFSPLSHFLLPDACLPPPSLFTAPCLSLPHHFLLPAPCLFFPSHFLLPHATVMGLSAEFLTVFYVKILRLVLAKHEVWHFHMEWRRMCQISFWNRKSGLVLLSFARPLLCASRYSSIALASKMMLLGNLVFFIDIIVLHTHIHEKK